MAVTGRALPNAFSMRASSRMASSEWPPNSKKLSDAPTVATVREEVAAVAQKIVVSQDLRKEQLSQIARDYHDATVHIVRTWLQEEAAKARTAGGGSPTIN